MLRAAARSVARVARRASSSNAAGVLVGASRTAYSTWTQAAVKPRVGRAALLAAMGVGMGTTVAMAASNQERSFIMVKPEGVQRALVGEVIKRFEQRGFKLVGLKVLVPSKDIANVHYGEHEGKPFFPKLVGHITSGAVVAMVWEGKDIVKTGRAMIGATNPLASAPGTIRGDFAIDLGRNIVHGSDSVDSAQREIALWFSPDELAEYDPTVTPWIYE
ncbi:FAP340 [Auxenochlorella protothecoides x Auxenochlorella symbiontica]|nr:Nucleoside diphosphate kinase [Auxenochlorella protothecoides]KFM23364.1 Nucleoside diphosphate kinase [Auxenochlorella protothecoides]